MLVGPRERIELTMKPSDVRVRDLSVSYQDYTYRTPIKFGGVAVDKVTLLNVDVVVENRSGRTSSGFGSMPLGNVWSFPSRVLTYNQTLDAMKLLGREIARITLSELDPAHPIDINWILEPAYLQAAAEVSRNINLAEPIPKLCTLVVASAFDAALHDGFGKVNGINCYAGYSEEYLGHDLGYFLGAAFAGERLSSYISRPPKASLPLYHLVGALDPIFDHDIAVRLNDGLPETLGEWVLADSLTHIKIKLDGDNLDWDVNRVLAVDRAITMAETQRDVDSWSYSLDFNERCSDVGYLLEFLRRIASASKALFDRVQYIEQPTPRDLKSGSSRQIREAAALKPMVIDESLVDFESLMLARELGYTGVALKACKGQSNALLINAAAQKFGMFLCVQDLTCPGASLIQSAGLAAHLPSVTAIESNARQYVPAANEAWKSRFPSIFEIRDGVMRTGLLDGLGLGAVPPQDMEILRNASGKANSV
jgi:L-alanine-DL-glutamate epimerase-like enolase superfamily enzyme